MRFPKEVEVFGSKISIKLKTPVNDDEGKSVDGMFDPNASTIYIDSNLSEEDRLHTLIHEMGHVVFHRTSLNQTSVGSDVEEIVVNNFATLITECFSLKFRRNGVKKN